MGQKLERIETMVTAILIKQTVKDWYNTNKLANWWARPSLRFGSGAEMAGFMARSRVVDVEHLRRG